VGAFPFDGPSKNGKLPGWASENGEMVKPKKYTRRRALHYTPENGKMEA